jgi:hypothetical protein
MLALEKYIKIKKNIIDCDYLPLFEASVDVAAACLVK